MMLALPHGTDPLSVSNQTTTLQHGFITYLESKQAAGIINLPVTGTWVLYQMYISYNFIHYHTYYIFILHVSIFNIQHHLIFMYFIFYFKSLNVKLLVLTELIFKLWIITCLDHCVLLIFITFLSAAFLAIIAARYQFESFHK